jgi:hypothetical protein
MKTFVFTSGVLMTPTLYFVDEYDLDRAWEALAKELQVSQEAAKASYRLIYEIPVKEGRVVTVSDAAREVAFNGSAPKHEPA